MDFQRSWIRVCVSQCSQFVASCYTDETVRVWHVVSGKLLHEFQPSKQLTTPITCMCFVTKPQAKSTSKKAGSSAKQRQCGVLALGTVDGRLMLYDWAAGAVMREWRAVAGSATVAALAWQAADRLAVLTTDNRLTVWDMSEASSIGVFSVKGHNSLCLLGDSSAAVSSQSIEVLGIATSTEWGDVRQGTVVHKFTGHPSQTTCLVPVPAFSPLEAPKWLLSASQNDIFVYCWELSQQPKVGRASLSPPAVTLKAVEHVRSLAASSGCVAVVSVTGILRVFGIAATRSREPIEELGRLTLYSDTKHDTVVPIVRAFNITKRGLAFVYGIGVCLKFERIMLSELRGDVKLIRMPSGAVRGEQSKLHILQSSVLHDNVTYATPAHMPLVKAPSRGKRKAGEEDPSTAALPMEALLLGMTSHNATDGQDGPATEALSRNKKSQMHLLIQGLHSGDAKLLHRVFSHSNPEVISRTLTSLPHTSVVPLLAHLQACLPTHWHKHFSYNKWFQGVLHHHTSFICSLPDKENLLRPFKQYCTAKRTNYMKILELQGRLNRMTYKLAAGPSEDAPAATITYTPLISVNDESSDEEEASAENALMQTGHNGLTNGYGSDSALEDGSLCDVSMASDSELQEDSETEDESISECDQSEELQ